VLLEESPDHVCRFGMSAFLVWLAGWCYLDSGCGIGLYLIALADSFNKFPALLNRLSILSRLRMIL
jgi:hypothetical protein